LLQALSAASISKFYGRSDPYRVKPSKRYNHLVARHSSYILYYSRRQPAISSLPSRKTVTRTSDRNISRLRRRFPPEIHPRTPPHAVKSSEPQASPFSPHFPTFHRKGSCFIRRKSLAGMSWDQRGTPPPLPASRRKVENATKQRGSSALSIQDIATCYALFAAEETRWFSPPPRHGLGSSTARGNGENDFYRYDSRCSRVITRSHQNRTPGNPLDGRISLRVSPYFLDLLLALQIENSIDDRVMIRHSL